MGRKPDSSGTSAAPFLAALAIIVLAVIGIGVVTLFRGGEDSSRESVVRAAIAHNDALQRLDYAAFRATTCPEQQGTEATVLDEQRASVAARGARYVDDVLGISVDGDTATATVVYHFKNSEDDKIETKSEFVNTDGTWRLCTPGPR
ncbi:lumazine-binding protein [Mycobacterium sp. ACS4331]|nr:lumazine-binding protein [Mycobacterium sp. ACS4331]